MDEPERNPYAPPTAPLDQAPVEAAGDLAEAEAVRLKYLNHEASVKSIGSLHFIAAFFAALVILGSVTKFGDGVGRIGNGRVVAIDVTVVFHAALTAFLVALGIGLNGLKTWARWVETAFVGLLFVLMVVASGLPVFEVLSRRGPGMAIRALTIAMFVYGIVALIPGYALYLLISRKGTVDFSPAYRVVIDRTPHIKYQTSCLVWFLILLVLFIASVAYTAIVSALSHR